MKEELHDVPIFKSGCRHCTTIIICEQIMLLNLRAFESMELLTQSLCFLIVSALSLCGATEYYVRPSEPTNTSCPAQPCLTLNEYASHSENYFTLSNIEFRFLPGTHLLNTSISVRNVHNVSFTSLETEKSPQIVFYKQSQCNNVSHDQMDAVKCTPFGFWNATAITIARLDVLVYPQNKPVEYFSRSVLGIGFTNVTQVHLHHCNITVENKTENTDYVFFNSVYLSDSEFVTVSFSTITSHQGSLSLLKTKHIDIANSTIVGGIEVHESAFIVIRDCNVSLFAKRQAIIHICKSRNINVFGIFAQSQRFFRYGMFGSDGVSIQHTNHTRIANVTVFNCSGTGLDLSYNIDTQVFNASLLFSDSGVYIGDSNNVALHDVGLWQVNFGIHMESVVKLKINNVFATGSIFGVFSAYNSRSLTIRHLTAVNWTGHSFYFQNITDIYKFAEFNDKIRNGKNLTGGE